MKGKVAGILLLLCLVAPLAATFIYLEYQKTQARKEVKQRIVSGIDDVELVTLKFTEEEAKTSLDWKDSKEFEYNDQMYDILQTEIKGDTTYYVCLPDHEETKLNKLISIALDHSSQNKDSQKRLANFLNSLFFTELNPLKVFNYSIREENSHYVTVYHSYISSPPSPPPKVG